MKLAKSKGRIGCGRSDGGVAAVERKGKWITVSKVSASREEKGGHNRCAWRDDVTRIRLGVIQILGCCDTVNGAGGTFRCGGGVIT